MTQNELVLGYLQTRGTIDPWTAMRDLHILRLGARIFDLRKAGHDIKTINHTATAYGKTVRWAEYVLKEPPADGTAVDSKGVAVEAPLPSENITYF